MIADLILSEDPIAALAAIPKSYLQNYAYEKAAADGRFVNADGDSMSGLLILSGDPAVALGAATRQFVENWAHAKATADARFVLKAGDTMGGVLNGIAGDSMRIGYGATAGQWGYTSFYDNTTRIGYVGKTPGNALYLVGDAAAVGGLRLQATAGGIDIVDVSTVRIDVNGNIKLKPATELQLYRPGTAGPHLGFYDDADVRHGYLQMLSTYGILTMAGYMRLQSAASQPIIFYPGAAEQARVDSTGQWFFQKTASAPSTVGQEFHANGRVWLTTDTAAGYNLVCGIINGASGNIFVDFRTGATAGTRIGSISQSGTAGVAFNTTSHGPHKGNVQDLDDDEAIERVLLWRPVSFQWKYDEDGEISELGTPQGEVEHGFIAQEMQEVNPNAVTPGYGNEAAHKEWVEIQKRRAEAMAINRELRREYDQQLAELGPDGADLPEPDYVEEPEDPGDDPFRAWQGDWTKLVPDLAAAMQAVIRQNRAQAARIEELERRLG
jgi:hypothetical protein